MAFKFKVKKRPSMGQAVASAFAAGVAQGANTALQDAMNESKNKKKQATQELNLFNSSISGLPSTPNNNSKILPIKSQIIKGQISASQGLDMLGIDVDFETDKQREASIKAESASLDPMVDSVERSARASIGMIGNPPTKMEEKKREMDAEKRIGIKGQRTPASTTEEKQLKALEREVITQANLAGMTLNQYLLENPNNPSVRLYTEMTQPPPATDSGMRLTDTAQVGSGRRSLVQPQFNTVDAESTSQSFEGTRIVNPNTGEVRILRNGQWQPID
jgi:hypothetical protein